MGQVYEIIDIISTMWIVSFVWDGDRGYPREGMTRRGQS